MTIVLLNSGDESYPPNQPGAGNGLQPMASTGAPQVDLDADLLDTEQRAALLTVQDNSALPEAPSTPESYHVQTGFAARSLGYITMSDLEQREAWMYAASYDPGLAALDNSEEDTCTVGEVVTLGFGHSTPYPS